MNSATARRVAENYIWFTLMQDTDETSTPQERIMNMNTTRLEDKLNAMVLVTVVAIVVSIGSAVVSVGVDASAPATAQVMATPQTVASLAAVAVR